MSENKFENDAEDELHLEVVTDRGDDKSAVSLKLDKHGLPLVPQPSDHKMDPLNWSIWLKLAVLAQISVISFLSLFAGSLIVGEVDVHNSQVFLTLRVDTGIPTALDISASKFGADRLCY
jgi:hypothetical protein